MVLVPQRGRRGAGGWTWLSGWPSTAAGLRGVCRPSALSTSRGVLETGVVGACTRLREPPRRREPAAVIPQRAAPWWGAARRGISRWRGLCTRRCDIARVFVRSGHGKSNAQPPRRGFFVGLPMPGDLSTICRRGLPGRPPALARLANELGAASALAADDHRPRHTSSASSSRGPSLGRQPAHAVAPSAASPVRSLA